MLFNSIDFAIFLPVVFLLYWLVFNKNRNLQNAFLLGASYFFYGWWDWRFLSLIIIGSTVDYAVGRSIYNHNDKQKKRAFLFISIFVNIGLLWFFKYFNFFIESFVYAFNFFGSSYQANRLNIILPLGISFYTFQKLSYTIDIYRGKLVPQNDGISFFAFISFFPQLVAGPIERASNLLPQFYKERRFDYDKAADGTRQILWGLFKKVVIADNCAITVNHIFANADHLSGSTLLLGAVLFSFQIYCDFSGYSDIAIGAARLFGFNLMRNFAFPYFSRDVAEFWRRWHISLSTWFRDYLYIPLGGSRGGNWMKTRNILIIFLVSGLWHGANWTFIVWGLVHSLCFLPLMLLEQNRKNTNIVAEERLLPDAKELAQMMATFGIVVIAWVFFRAENIHHAFLYLKNLFSLSLFSMPESASKKMILFIALLISIEWIQRDKLHALQMEKNRPIVRRLTYLIVFSLIFVFGEFGGHEFIYFQF